MRIQRAGVILVQESIAACISLNGHSAFKVHFLFHYNTTKPQLLDNKISEYTDIWKLD